MLRESYMDRTKFRRPSVDSQVGHNLGPKSHIRRETNDTGNISQLIPFQLPRPRVCIQSRNEQANVTTL